MQNPADRPRRSPPERLPARTAWAWTVLPLDDDGGRWRIGVTVDADPELAQNLAVLLGAPVETVIMSAADIRAGLTTLYGVAADTLDGLPADDPVANEMTAGDDSAMARVVNELIARAMAERATDIHIEPDEGRAGVRLRIDGLLRPLDVAPALAAHLPRLVSRIKVMAGMNIAERRLPQDGRLRFDSPGATIDVRVSTIPTIHGETIDLRLLPRRQSALRLEDLGLSETLQAAIAALLRRPNGLFLVTGPTGHGKTTTLYACLARLNTPERKIVTIEDPVEVRLPGAHQIQAHPAIGLTFAAALRAVLRQDPDILMVGEIRDRETAEIAIRASLTGHLVFSTLHTNDAASAVTRLVDMGVDPYLVASSVTAVLAQRLVRVRCAACSGVGCGECRETGFRGRTGLFELLPLTDPLRALIMSVAPARDVRRAAAEAGVPTLFDDGRGKAEAGLTTLDEVRRVVEEPA